MPSLGSINLGKSGLWSVSGRKENQNVGIQETDTARHEIGKLGFHQAQIFTFSVGE